MFWFSKYEETEKKEKKKKTQPKPKFPLSLFLSQKKDIPTGNMFSRNKNPFEQSQNKEAKKIFLNNMKKKTKGKYFLWQG